MLTNRQSRTHFLSLTSTLLLFTLTSAQSFATNGYFTHGVGIKNKALAGAGSASPSEALATAINPAAAIYVGNRFEVGLSIFSPRRSYRASGSSANGQNGTFTIDSSRINSDNKSFPIPYIGKIWERGKNSAFALNFYGRGGMNTEFRHGAATFDPDGPGELPVTTSAGTFGAGTAGVDLSQAFLDLTYAQRSGSVNWGVSFVLAAQSFAAQGLRTFAPYTERFARSEGTQVPTRLTNNGHELVFGYGAKAGVIWEATRRLNLAVSYQSETKMQDFERYSDLFADNGAFNVPANLRIGASWQATNSTTLHFDIDRTYFSDIDSVGNSFSNLVDCPTAGFGGTNVEACLGGDDGPGFGWEDVTTYHLGLETYFSGAPRWLWRAGYSKSNSPIRSSESLFNILAPAVIEEHYTFGASRKLDDGKTFSVGFMYAPGSTSRGPNAFDPTQTIELDMHQFEFEVGISW